MLKQSHKAYLKECIRKLNVLSKISPLSESEQLELQRLQDEYDSHQTYLEESGLACQDEQEEAR